MNERGVAPATGKKFPWWILLIALVPVMVSVLGVGAALAIYGVRKYITNAKEAEGRQMVVALAKGIATCASTPGADGSPRGLPDSAAPVPRDGAQVSGRKYQSAPADWREEAYACAGFRQDYPQYFQYRWERSSATEGRAVALADLDGDGGPDVGFELSVSCSDAGCTLGQLEEQR